MRNAPGWTWKANGRDNQGRFDFLVAETAYATGPALHTHAIQEDTFFVLDGVLTVRLGNEVVELGPGDFATAPPGVPHSFTNTQGNHTCRAVNLMTPGIGFDGYIDQIEKVVASGTADAIERLNLEYGLTVVGPTLAEELGLLAARRSVQTVWAPSFCQIEICTPLWSVNGKRPHPPQRSTSSIPASLAMRSSSDGHTYRNGVVNSPAPDSSTPK
jgi:mannose-6-phosphate isomerase-like protein (cupin superfamily)